eukprot:g25845.t1
MVCSPYSNDSQEFAKNGAAYNLCIIARLSWTKAWLLAMVALLNLLAAAMLAFWAELFTNTKSVIKPGTTSNFHAFGHQTSISISYSRMMPVILFWGPALGARGPRADTVERSRSSSDFVCIVFTVFTNAI